MINKLSDEHAILKQSLLFTGLESIKYNLNRKQNNLKFFEFDKTYNRVDNKIKETKKIGIYMTGLYQDEHFDVKSKQVSFFELFNTINKIMIQSNIIYDSIATKSKILDDCINITINKKTLATIGKVKKELLSSFEINQDLYYAELEWENYTNNLNHNLKYKSISNNNEEVKE